jgi:hypothetical protein
VLRQWRAPQGVRAFEVSTGCRVRLLSVFDGLAIMIFDGLPACCRQWEGIWVEMETVPLRLHGTAAFFLARMYYI